MHLNAPSGVSHLFCVLTGRLNICAETPGADSHGKNASNRIKKNKKKTLIRTTSSLWEEPVQKILLH